MLLCPPPVQHTGARPSDGKKGRPGAGRLPDLKRYFSRDARKPSGGKILHAYGRSQHHWRAECRERELYSSGKSSACLGISDDLPDSLKDDGSHEWVAFE